MKAKQERRKRRRQSSEGGEEGAFEGDDEMPADEIKSDAEWYREEVGEQPDPGMFRSSPSAGVGAMGMKRKEGGGVKRQKSRPGGKAR